MKYLIKGKEIYTPHGIFSNTGILVEDGRIKGFGNSNDSDCREIDLENCRIIPGLIDMHIHGSNGFDTMDASYTSMNGISEYLARNGVTAFLAATVTADMARIRKAISNAATCMNKGLNGARLIGSYVEGPYISREFKGAHPENNIREIERVEIESLLKAGKGTVKVITIAPEIKNSLAEIKYLTAQGVKVSLGHTNATYAEAVKAIESGAGIAVHLFNGMRGLHHREAGMLGAALNDDRIQVEMICDGVHVDIPAMQIVTRCKDYRDIILITDCMMAGGLKDGEYVLGEAKVFVKDNIARVESGSLAGSTLKLMDAVKNMVEMVGVPFEKAVQMASLNPARAIGIERETGSLAVGNKADITAVDENYNTVFTMVNGKIVYSRKICEIRNRSWRYVSNRSGIKK